MNTYLIKLSPLSSFFFGSEATFGQEINRNYFVKSRHWPQQTTLLGMLRYELLKASPEVFDLNKDSVINPKGAQAIIGESGFDPQEDKNFGIIERLSPVFLLSPDGIPYFQLNYGALDGASRIWLDAVKAKVHVRNLLVKTQEGKPVERNMAYLLGVEKKQNSTLHSAYFDAKTDFKTQLINAAGHILPLDFDDNESPNGVFISVNRTGNRKNYEGSTDDSGFYKQDMYQLRSGWAFGFLTEINAGWPPSFGTQRKVQVGAERSMFNLTVSKTAKGFQNDITLDTFSNLFPNNIPLESPVPYSILINDAYTESHPSTSANFAISSNVSFRFMTANMVDPNSLWNRQRIPKSMRFNMAERGSIFLRNEAIFFPETGAFHRIGYNYFKTIQPSSHES